MSRPLERLGNLLNIDIDGWGQDWEFVYADTSRITEFCDLYEREGLTSLERGELMRLIVASYDVALDQDSSPEATWGRISCLLKADFIIHKGVVEYWGLAGETDTDNLFSVTPLMREVLRDCGGGEI